MVRNAKTVAVQNKKGENFNARVVFTDFAKDLVILKIEDDSFKTLTSIPYGISKSSSDLAEPIFTLGFPRNDEIVYGEGYLSAKTGFNGDTLSCQISIAANPGNSGGPILNHNGEVIGILSTRQDFSRRSCFCNSVKIHLYCIERFEKDRYFYESENSCSFFIERNGSYTTGKKDRRLCVYGKSELNH